MDSVRRMFDALEWDRKTVFCHPSMAGLVSRWVSEHPYQGIGAVEPTELVPPGKVIVVLDRKLSGPPPGWPG